MEKKQTHISYGFIAGIIMVVINLVLYITGVTLKPGMQWVAWIAYIPFLVAIIMNANAYSKANNGNITFGNAFGSCFKCSMIVAIVIVAYSIATIFIFPDMKDRILAMQREQLAKNPKMTDEMIDTSLNMIKKSWNLILILGAVFGTMLTGTIFSLIGAAVAKKNPVMPAAYDSNS